MGLMKTYLPPVETAMQLEPEELAMFVLEALCDREDRGDIGSLCLNNFVLPQQFADYVHEHEREGARRAVVEAWSWLEREGLIAPQPDQAANARWIFVTRRGRRLRVLKSTREFRAATMLPPDVIDSMLATKARPPFIRGDYDSAVFEAMKEVEIRVRSAAGLTTESLGVHLMREAFKPNAGKLADPNQHISEQEGVSSLFAGAIATFKNPTSHRDLNLQDPMETLEVIMLADLLLRIVERRRPAEQAAQPPAE